MPTASRPNLIVVMAEQLSALCDPAYAPMPVDVPHLQSLAATGTRFARAYCNAPVCGPSRLSFLTGRYAHRVQAYDNGSELPRHLPTFAHVLARAGYETVMCGRMHLHGDDPMRGFERRLSSELINPLPGCRADWPGLLEPIRPLAPDPGIRYEPAFRDSPIYRHDAYVTQQAVAFLEERGAQPPTRPFFLVAGYFAAHPGASRNPDYAPLYRKYLERDLPVPAFTPADYERLPEHARRLHQYHRSDARIFNPDYHRRRLAHYLAGIEYFDQQLGQMLAAVRRSDMDRDTVILVTADHGEMTGVHGLWGKMAFYEPAQRVPLYLAGPGAPAARTVQDTVSLVDVLPTLAELGGAAVPFPVDGRSLWPRLHPAGAIPAEAPVFSEYHGYLSPGDMYMLRRGDHKLCCYRHEATELYNLARDPCERENLASTPAYAAVLAALKHELRTIVDIDAEAARIATYNAQREAVADAWMRHPTIAREIWERNHDWRARLAEPWWDGGEYLGEGNPPLT